jgi:hypothetical protein
MDTVTQNQPTVECEVLTVIGETVEVSNEHSGTELTDGTL